MTSPIIGGISNGQAFDLNSPTGKAVFDALRKDSLQNLITGLGVEGKDARLSTTVTARTRFSQNTIDTLYEQDDIFPLIVDRIPEHATRRWIRMTGAMTSTGRPDKDFGRTAIEALEALDTQQSIFELFRLHRKDGGGAILLGANDGLNPSQPLNLERIQSVDYLHVLTRYEITPGEIDKNPKTANFRKPLFYTLNEEPNQRIHHSRVIRLARHMIGSETSAGAAGGWDLPIIERVWEPLRQFTTLLGYIEACFQDIAQGVMSIAGLPEVMAAGDVGANAVINRVRTIAYVRSAMNVILLDADSNEKYERRSQFPSGINEPVLRCMDRLCAAADTPMSILFQQQPTGLSSDDAGGRKNFYDSTANKQNRLLRSPITRILDAAIAAKKGPFKGKGPKQWSFEFRPLEEPSEMEIETRRKTQVDTETALAASGFMAPEEIRSRYENDPDCPYQLSEEVSDALKAANEPIAPEEEDDDDLDLDLDEEDEEDDAEESDREDSFDESQHPRDPDGKFGSGGGVGAAPKVRTLEEIKANTEALREKAKAIKAETARKKKEFAATLRAEKKRHEQEMKATRKAFQKEEARLNSEIKRVRAETRKIEAGLAAEDRAGG